MGLEVGTESGEGSVMVDQQVCRGITQGAIAASPPHRGNAHSPSCSLASRCLHLCWTRYISFRSNVICVPMKPKLKN